MNEPLVTVNILSFNRKDELRNTLQKVFEQDYKNIEVIVVDNASSDGSPEMVKTVFPQVILIELEKNIGIAGWNKGFEVAQGEYVLVLDDDAYPDKYSLSLAVEKLVGNKKAACISFNVKDIKSDFRSDWLPDENINESKIPVFIGCAAIFDKSKCKNKPMPENYFIYQHELPVSAEIYIRDYEIFYYKEIIAFHNFKYSQKYNLIADKFYLKNNMKFIAKYLPLPLAILYHSQIILFYLTLSIKKRWFKEYLKIVFLEKKYILRKKISLKYFFELRKLHLFNFSLIGKVLK